MSVEALAQKLGVEPSTLRNAEMGRGTKVFQTIGTVFPEIAEEVAEAWRDYKASNPPESDALPDTVFGHRKSTRNVEGEWHALWQTTVDGQPNFNTEVLSARWTKARSPVLVLTNQAISDENKKGGYLWRADLRFFDNMYLAGIYLPTDTKTTMSKGTMFGVVHRSGQMVSGMWAGCNYDEELTGGHFVFCRDKDQLWQVMSNLIHLPINEIKKSFT